MTALLTALALGLHAQTPRFAERLGDRDACFILLDSKTERPVHRWRPKRCARRLPACSTFKAPLAAAAFDSGALAGEEHPFPWDGIQYPIPAWNRDHTARSWMTDSVVWYSQRLTPLIGREPLERRLREFSYGTADLSGGLAEAWLTIAPFLKKPPKTTLLVSADEQARFWARLWTGRLPISSRAQELTKAITFIETSPRGWALHGKTGSGLVGKPGRRLGWFVGHLERGAERYAVVVSLTDKKPLRPDDPPYAGGEARQAAKDLLLDAGLW